jgi:hypothetical protein
MEFEQFDLTEIEDGVVVIRGQGGWGKGKMENVD